MPGIAGAIGFNAAEAAECMSTALRHRGIANHQRTGYTETGLPYSLKGLGDALINDSFHPPNVTIEMEDRGHSSFARARMNGESLTLTRDFVGSCPLFYGSDDAHTLCAFASERKALWDIGIGRIQRVEPGSIVTIKRPDDVTVHAQETRHRDAEILVNVDDAAKRLLKLLKDVIEELRHVSTGVAFSGGLDSSLLCGLITDRAENSYYTTGLPGAFDIKNAQHAARLLGIHLDILQFSLIDIESMLPQVIATIETCEPMHVALSIPQHIITQRAASDGFKTVMMGQGADELFGGYYKYQALSSAQPHKIGAALTADVHNIAANNLERDNFVAAANSVGIILPYLDPRIVSLGLSIDWTLKLKDGINKYVLRKAAKNVLPSELACKRKKALQYGTGAAAALKKLAHKNGKKTVSDYLRTIAEKNDIRVAA
ncbi:MAG: asparagine synthase family protein [Halobacteriota archaeon]